MHVLEELNLWIYRKDSHVCRKDQCLLEHKLCSFNFHVIFHVNFLRVK